MVYNSKFRKAYGKTVEELSKELGVSAPTLCTWHKRGFDIYDKAKTLNGFRRIGHRLNALWNNLQSRCGDPSDKRFHRYGGRGIKLRLERRDLVYLWERDNASQLKRPSIDRIDNDGHYEVKNCRFIELAENSRRRKKSLFRPFRVLTP